MLPAVLLTLQAPHIRGSHCVLDNDVQHASRVRHAAHPGYAPSAFSASQAAWGWTDLMSRLCAHASMRSLPRWR